MATSAPAPDRRRDFHHLRGRYPAGQRGGLEAIPYLPPYSPDLNPIEQVFAKLKALLRDTAARATEALWAAVGRLLACFQPAECARYLAHCGYGRSG